MQINDTTITIIKANIKSIKADVVASDISCSSDLIKAQDDVRRAYAKALKSASKRIKRAALPILGLAQKFPLVGSAKIFAQEFLKFSKNNTSKKEIIICTSDTKSLKIFKDTVFSYIEHIQNDLGPEPYVTADIIIELKEGVILIERSNPPYGLALPGGFLDAGESLEECAIREAKEETNMKLEGLRQFHTYSKPGRDPRFQTVTAVFIAKGKGHPKPGDDARGLKVVKYTDLMKLDYAFDHKEVIREYLKLREAAH